jgi:hypothetical protein
MIGQRVGKYRLERLLGEGGMGMVYEAVRTDIGGRAAIKLLRPGLALHPDTSARFFNEARAANIIDHPGIVKVIDYGHMPSGEAYLAMEFLDGESLFQRLTRERRLSEADTLRIGRQIAAALAAAHAKQIVHRDLKPENVFIVPDSEATGGERAKILDFGIAKLTREHQGTVRTQTNALMGTPIYMSPEQCRGKKDITDRTDVYALGTMLYELLAGRPPFVAEDPGEYISLHMYQMPAPLSSLAPHVAPGLMRLIESMLAKEPTVRPAMSAVARVLKELGNLSSDVLSVRAMSEGFDGETQPLLRAISLVRPGGMGGAPPAPISEVRSVVSLGAPPPPPPSIERAAASRDRQLPVDALDRTDPMPPGSLPESIDPPTIHDPVPARSAPLPPPRPQEDSTRQFDRAAMPTPAGQVGEAAWQPLAVLPGSSVISKPDADSGIVDPRSADRRAKSLGRRLRRLRFKLRKRVYGWLGIPIHDRRNTPAATSRSRSTILVGGAVLATLGLLIFFGLRHSPHPGPPIEGGQPMNPDVQAPVEPPPPTAPPPASPPRAQLPEALATALLRARERAFAADMTGALKLSREAARTHKHPAAWSAMGEYACMARKLNRANEARSALVADGNEEAQRQLKHMLEVCRLHYVVEQDGKLVVSSGAR